MTRVHRLLVPTLLLAASVCPRHAVAAPNSESASANGSESASPKPKSPRATEPTPADATNGTARGGLVLLISERADDPFLERIKAELVAMGFATVVRPNDVALERAAREVNAVAAIRLLPSRQGVEVWMADRTSGRSLLRQVIVDENPSGPNQSVVALQTAELLRTSLIQQPSTAPAPAPTSPAEDSPAHPPGHTEPPPSTLEPEQKGQQPSINAATPPPSAGLQAALGALYSPGGADAALQLWLSLPRSFSKHVALAIDLSAPLLTASLTTPEGTTRIGSYLAGVSFLLQTRSESGLLFVNGGVGVGASRLSFSGEASPPLLGRSGGVTSATAYVRSDLGVELLPWLRLGARGTAGATSQKMNLALAGNDGGSWGRIYAGAFFLAEVPWR